MTSSRNEVDSSPPRLLWRQLQSSHESQQNPLPPLLNVCYSSDDLVEDLSLLILPATTPDLSVNVPSPRTSSSKPIGVEISQFQPILYFSTRFPSVLTYNGFSNPILTRPWPIPIWIGRFVSESIIPYTMLLFSQRMKIGSLKFRLIIREDF